MPKAVKIYETGGPGVMRWEDYNPGDPAPGEIRLRHEAVGLNFIDVYHRNGLYPLPALPAHRLVPLPEGISFGEGVDVVYDSVGRDTFMKSLDCLRPMGTMVSFGQSCGSVPPLDVGTLSAKGSLFLTRPSLMTYTAKREDLLAHARDLFDMVESGTVTISIGQTYDLKDAAQAHQNLEARKTTGSTVLMP